jgi:hypothetical protein
MPNDNRSLIQVVVADGRPLIQVTAYALLFSGAFAIFLAVRREFLPHDLAFLQMTPEDLCALGDCRVVAFMFHDRVAFGGTLMAIGTLYLWLDALPLASGEAWAWWALTISGVLGFASFLAYLGYGYLDTWHGAATACLLPVFAAGLIRAYPLMRPATVRQSVIVRRLTGRRRLARLLLLATGGGMLLAGLTILIVGMTTVFVPQDLGFMGLTAMDLHAANARLVPLIAHDRAGFGGGLVSCGTLVLACAACAEPSRSLWQALLVAGSAGFGGAIGVHVAVGYTDAVHLLPAVVGAGLFAASVGLESAAGTRIQID